jgi:hypothetical protein
MLGLVLLLQLASVGGVGELPPPVDASLRQRPRLRAALSLGASAGFSSYANAAGLGFSAEVGSTWSDEVSLVARVTVGTIVSLNVLSAGAAVDLQVSEYLSLGAGLSVSLLTAQIVGTAMSLVVGVPFRLHFAPFPRAAHEVRRTGLMLFVEAAPGLSPFGVPGDPRRAPTQPGPFAVTMAMGIGSAWW